MLINVVQTAFQICDKTEYAVEGRCSSCGGALSGYDRRVKRFAVLRDDKGDHPIGVILHRAYCRDCGRILVPEEPFYPGTRVGSPVVDLCRTLSTTMPYGQVAGRLGQMGIKVDRWSVRSYCNLPFTPPPVIAAFGMHLPISVISLSALAAALGDTSRIHGEDVLAACNHPSLNQRRRLH
jgi:hypothetical protein